MKKPLILIPTDSVDELLELYEQLVDLSALYRKSKTIRAGTRLRKCLSEIQKKAKISRAEVITRRRLKAAAVIPVVHQDHSEVDPAQTQFAL